MRLKKMNISQVAQQTGLSAKQIRDYEKYGLLPKTARTLAGYRDYQDADVQRLRFIRHAREVGFSLAQIAQLLQLQDNPHRQSRDVKQLTAQHIAELNQKINVMIEMRNQLQTWHDECAGNEHASCCILEGLAAIELK